MFKGERDEPEGETDLLTAGENARNAGVEYSTCQMQMPTRVPVFAALPYGLPRQSLERGCPKSIRCTRPIFSKVESARTGGLKTGNGRWLTFETISLQGRLAFGNPF